MNFKMIRYTLGWILVFEAGFLLLPLLCGAIYGEKEALAYLYTAIITAACGGISLIKKPKDRILYAKEGFVIVSLSWILLSLFGALPFLFTGEIPRFADALFESASGFTTTGSSILASVEELSHATLLWRSFMHWVGGMGVLVFVMAFIPLSGGRNLHIMKAESPGPSVSKLVPKMRSTALILYVIYFVITLAQFLILVICGMAPFEAINTAFATAGTGGFGFRNDSFASFSPLIQTVVAIFMLIFSINFTSYYFLWKGRLRDALNAEVRVFLIIVISAIAIITANLMMWGEGGLGFGDTLRQAFFTVSSIVSTTGFITADFELWPALSKTILMLLLFMGACAGSTGGGLKVSRIMLLVKGMAKEFAHAIQPKRVIKIKMDKHIIEPETIKSVNSYIVCYIAVFIGSMLLISFENHDMVTNFTAVATTLGNVGPGLSKVGPTANFAFFTDFSKYVLVFNMLAGRLELLPMLLLFNRETYRK